MLIEKSEEDGMNAALHDMSSMAFARHIRAFAADEEFKAGSLVNLLHVFNIFQSLMTFHETGLLDA